jgi:hypothetical protein
VEQSNVPIKHQLDWRILPVRFLDKFEIYRKSKGTTPVDRLIIDGLCGMKVDKSYSPEEIKNLDQFDAVNLTFY